MRRRPPSATRCPDRPLIRWGGGKGEGGGRGGGCVCCGGGGWGSGGWAISAGEGTPDPLKRNTPLKGLNRMKRRGQNCMDGEKWRSKNLTRSRLPALRTTSESLCLPALHTNSLGNLVRDFLSQICKRFTWCLFDKNIQLLILCCFPYGFDILKCQIKSTHLNQLLQFCDIVNYASPLTVSVCTGLVYVKLISSSLTDSHLSFSLFI